MKIRLVQAIGAGLAITLILLGLAVWVLHDDYTEVYQSSYIGSDVCGGCHVINHAAWKQSPHHKITQEPNVDTVVGDFNNGQWLLPEKDRKTPLDDLPAIKTYTQGDSFFMALRYPGRAQYYPFKVDRVVGYQYRQTYLTQERGGVLRRLPVQWSVSRGDFFSYWNEQEKSQHSVQDLWEQMQPLNSAWNLYCARCHTTNLDVLAKDPAHTIANTNWTEPGVGCETCHGPGRKHVEYMGGKPTNRLMSFFNQILNEKTAPYIMNASSLDKGVALSVCARCHGSDIKRKRMDLYRTYEPGFDQHGRYNDLSRYFTEAKLIPGSNAPTVEVWKDGRPKGLGMLFRSFADSRHYAQTDMRCYSCHDAHNNKLEAAAGLKSASFASNQFCLDCHADIASDQLAHTKHAAGQAGSYCYDCHMPKNIANAVAGDVHYVRSHNMGSIPNPYLSIRYGVENSPNACNDCHQDRAPEWALKKLIEWQQTSHLRDSTLHPNRNAEADVFHISDN
ncbi:multiheme c-type cytochrome [Arenicella xantha]|uniref:Putative CXXCH cytochrome family protein n=1 Tax=Arenicella xantha TaxID=644221 RepID=A0A395JKP4_9GAMM|nr:multiheme c-type cytochrome [Arenicella xantha]RBP51139.1 putative CXXCH cytochrome family protein [Arenicella xantha]